MTKEKLNEILEKHKLWLRGDPNGSRADLSGADLSGADLSGADLSGADLSEANLSRASLRGAGLFGANLREANLSRADLSRASLSGAGLFEANLSRASLRGANLSRADLSRASLSGAGLFEANLSRANLSGAGLFEANLSRANLSEAILSGAKGLSQAVNYMKAHFERTDAGYVAYKTFNSQYAAPDTWEIKPGSILAENVNFDRCTECGCGINVAPLEWVRSNNGKRREIWKVLIRWEWLCGVCVPYNTDGKIRCERAELLEIV